jgi:hypothetical protein
MNGQWSFLQSHNSIGLVVSNKKIFKISTNQNTLLALAAMLDFRSAPKTQILYMTIQWTFLPSLVQICFVFAGMIIGWSCTKLVNRLVIGNSRWPPWLDLILTNIFPIGSYVKTMFADGCHLGWRSRSQDILCFWCWSEIQHGCQGL